MICIRADLTDKDVSDREIEMRRPAIEDWPSWDIQVPICFWRLMNIRKTNGRPEPSRPRVIPAKSQVLLRGFGPGIRTNRGRQKLCYCLQGLTALRHDEEFRWLVDWDRMMRGDDSAWQPKVVSELGRLNNPEMIRGVARILCKRRPDTQMALTLIRRVMMMAENPGDAAELAKAIEAAIAGYRKAHPTLSFDQIVEALAMQSEVFVAKQKLPGDES